MAGLRDCIEAASPDIAASRSVSYVRLRQLKSWTSLRIVLVLYDEFPIVLSGLDTDIWIFTNGLQEFKDLIDSSKRIDRIGGCPGG